MQAFYLCFVCFILADICMRTKAQGPMWITPETLTVDASSSGFCDSVAVLDANSGDGTRVYYSIQSQTPEGGFFTFENEVEFQDELRCDENLIVQSQYTVGVRGIQSDGNREFADRTIVITFNGIAPPAVDECTDGTHDCDTNANCFDTEDSFTCTCKAGYTGDGTSCADANECTNGNNNCDADAFCNNTDGSFTCTCADGYTGDGTSCTDKDECTDGTNNCDDNADCSNLVGGFVCTCTLDFIGDGESCTKLQWPSQDTIDGNYTTDEEACSLVTSLDAVTDIDKSVEYSIRSQTPNEAFTISEMGDEKILTCSQASMSVQVYTVVVRATISGTSLYTDQTLTISVKVPPTFVDPNPDPTSDDHYIYVCETLQAGEEVMVLVATDEDEDSTRTFNMSESDAETLALFEIVGDKLMVKADAPVDVFDLEKASVTLNYSVFLRVSDGVRDSTLETYIIVEDDNDNAPVFSGPTTKTILETVPAGTSVIGVTATDSDFTEENNQVIFTLTGATEFELNGTTIQVAEGVVFDVQAKSTFTFNITASDNVTDDTQTTDQEFTITIESEPIFVQLNESTAVNENIDENYVIYNFEVTDRDGTGTLVVTVVKSGETFEVENNEFLKLKQGKTLDAETTQIYEVQLKASDGTYEVLSDIMTINVLDINDNPPIFLEPNHVVTIAETEPSGTIVFTVSAEDADVSNQTLKYSMSEIGKSHFSIDENNGEIRTSTTLSYADNNHFNLQVTVKDGDGEDAKSADTVITVKLKTAPRFVDPVEGSFINITETTPTGKSVKSIFSFDPDGDNTPTYELLSQSPETTPLLFDIQGSDIITKGAFDVDPENAVTAYTLELKVSDGRSYTDNETISFTVYIEDSNDNYPTFLQASTPEPIPETDGIGTTVFTVAAMDSDRSQPNNLIKYSMTGTSDFNINEDTGEILVAASLEYDQTSQYDLVVTATDKGTPAQSATTDITLTLLAEPKFTNLPATVNINENSNVDTEVFTLTVADGDDTWNGIVLISSPVSSDFFKVEGTSVKTKSGDLDAETETTYSLTFKVIDGPFEVESGKLTVNITDLNDNVPFITPVDPLIINENKELGTTVFVIEATDDDITEENNVLTYSIISGNDDDIFQIDGISGIISLEKKPVSEQYNLTIKASDSGTNVLTATTEVTINVNDSPNDECSSNPCQNNGTCSSTVNSYLCSCLPGWNGTNCEINIDECSPNPCENDGLCSDGINSFTCNCIEGWGGETCITECTNSTYGRNCAEQCNCNSSRLISGVESQQCDIKNGACKCNEYWVGDACETDVDECSNSTICSEKANLICENTMGSYYCACKQWYVNRSGNCVIGNIEITVTPGEGEISVNVSIRINTTCPDLTKPSVYQMEKQKIANMIRARLNSSKRFEIVNITCGTVNFDIVVIADREDASNLSNEISNLQNSVNYDGRTVPVNEVRVNNNPINDSSSMQSSEVVCEVYTSIISCAKDETCVYENGQASCKLEESDNIALILGLGLGVCLPLLLMLILASICFFCQWKERVRYGKKRRHNGWRKGNSPWNGRLHSNGMKLDTRNYIRDQQYNNGNFNGNLPDKRRHIDLPAVGYTTI